MFHDTHNCTVLFFLVHTFVRYSFLVPALLTVPVGYPENGWGGRSDLLSVGLDWYRREWIESDWIGLRWMGMCWTGLDWIWLGWIRLDGMEWNDLEWNGTERNG